MRQTLLQTNNVLHRLVPSYLSVYLLLIIWFACVPAILCAQAPDSISGKLSHLSSRLLGRIDSKTASLNRQLTNQTQKYLRQMLRQEARLQRRLSASDSNAAKELFIGTAERYTFLANRLQQDNGSRSMLVSGAYMPYTDSLRGTLAFLQQNPELMGRTVGSASSLTATAQADLQKATGQLQTLQAKLQDATDLQQYMQQRQAHIQQYITKYTHLPADISSAFSSYQTQAGYYKQQVRQYEDALNDPDKLLQTALTVLNTVPAFTSFMQRNSVLSSLVPGGSTVTQSDPTKPGLGLPGRDQVLADLQERLGKTSGLSAAALAKKSTNTASDAAAGGKGAGGSGMPSQLAGLIGLLNGIGTGGTSGAASTGNTPPNESTALNPEKTRTFLHRLELGLNLQNTPGSYLLPTTTDIGVSLGYKLTGQNRVGIGASYKIGWTGDLRHLKANSQGMAIRSFLDIAVSRNWLASGGMEMNYQPVAYTLHSFRDLQNWQPAGLVGVTKVFAMKSKFVKNTRLQFLWDFLSYYQRPAPQAFIFRIGYSL